VDVSKDGKTLALGGPKGVVLCDLDGKVSARIGNTPAGPRNPNQDRLLAWQDWSYPRFAPDGKSLAVASSDSPTEVRLCKLDGTEVRRIALSKRYLDSAFSPDGMLVAVAERDDTVRVYETATGQRKCEWPVKITRKQANENYLFKVVWSPDGKTVAVAASDKLIHLWEMPSGKKAGELRGHTWYPWGLAFTKDSKTLYSTGWDGDVRRWDLATRKQLPLPLGIRGSALVAYAPDGRTVAYADGDNNLRLVDPKTGQERKVLAVPGLAPDQMTFSPDVRSLAVGGVSGDDVTVCVLSLETGAVIKRWDWPKGNDPHASVEDLAFSADGRRLATISFRQHSARVWDLTTDKEALVLKHQEGYGLAFSPDGRTLVTCGWDRKLKFWDPADGKLKKEFPVTLPKEFAGRDDVRVFGVAWSPDGSRVAATDLGGRLWIWDADTMKVRAVTDTKDIPRYNTLAFSPDGLWIATGGAGAKAMVWDAWTGQKVWERGAHKADLFKVCFGRDSRTLLSGASDGLGYLWDLHPKDVPTDAPAALWPSLVGPDGSAAYRAFWAMLDKPDAAVAAIAEQAKAFTATVEPAQAKQWVADLDSPKFAVREAAEKELSARLRGAVPYLRETVNKSGSAEQRSRVQKLLAEWEGSRPRWSRVVSLLAHLGTPAAKDLLRSWAELDPDGDLGRAARAALTKP
jgi:WD40 repeat protein